MFTVKDRVFTMKGRMFSERQLFICYHNFYSQCNQHEEIYMLYTGTQNTVTILKFDKEYCKTLRQYAYPEQVEKCACFIACLCVYYIKTSI